MQIQKQNPHSA